MAQVIRRRKNEWLVRLSAGRDARGKRQVLNRIVKGDRGDVDRFIRQAERERYRDGQIAGTTVNSCGGRGWVYAARMIIPNYEPCPIKIGYTRDPDRRRQMLQASGPFEVEWIACWEAEDGRYSESDLHNYFREHRLTGEWFRPSPEMLAWLDRIPK